MCPQVPTRTEPNRTEPNRLHPSLPAHSNRRSPVPLFIPCHIILFVPIPSHPTPSTRARLPTPVGAYLAAEEIVAIAKEQGVDAIHPGYLPLANAPWANLCSGLSSNLLPPHIAGPRPFSRHSNSIHPSPVQSSQPSSALPTHTSPPPPPPPARS